MKSLSRALAAALLLAASVPAHADDNQIFSIDYVERVGDDLWQLPQQPLHFSAVQWGITGGVLLATFGAYTIDGRVDDWSFKHRIKALDTLSDVTTHFGDYRYEVPLLLASWAGGTAADYEPLKKFSADGAEASLFAAGIVGPLIVDIAGRPLPGPDRLSTVWHPFAPAGTRVSFPSGHTEEAFAVATAFDQDFREDWGYWQTPVVYAIATGTAISRVYDHEHYVSDCVLGAAIGTSISYWIANRPRNRKKKALSFDIQPDGARLSYAF